MFFLYVIGQTYSPGKGWPVLFPADCDTANIFGETDLHSGASHVWHYLGFGSLEFSGLLDHLFAPTHLVKMPKVILEKLFKNYVPDMDDAAIS